jgi:outer membrane protein insertion porin family
MSQATVRSRVIEARNLPRRCGFFPAPARRGGARSNRARGSPASRPTSTLSCFNRGWEVNTSPSPARRARLRRVLVVGAALATVAILLLGFGLFPQEPVRRLVESRLRDAVGPGSRLGRLDLTPFLLRAEVRDLHLEGRGYTLDVPEGGVTLAPRALRGELALRSLSVEGPELRLTPSGETDSEEDGGLLVPAIDHVTVREARVRWTSEGGDELAIGGLSAEGALGTGVLSLEAPRATWTGEDVIALGPARARLATSRAPDAVLESLEVHAPGARIAAEGTLVRHGAVALDLDLEAALDLEQGGAALGLPSLGGDLELTGRAEGSPGEIHVTLEGRGTSRWEGWSVEDLTLSLDGRLDPRQVEAHLEGRTLGGRIVGQGRLEGDRTRGLLRGEDLDLTRLPPESRPPFSGAGEELELSWEGPLDGELEVGLSARVRGRGEGAEGRLAARAEGTVHPVEGTLSVQWSAGLTGEAAEPAPFSFRLDASGGAEGAWPPDVTGRISGTLGPEDAAPETETALDGRFSLRGRDAWAEIGSRGLVDLDGELTIRGDRLEEASLSATSGDLGRLRPEASGEARLEARASGPLRNPEISALLSVAGLEWGGAALGRLELGADGNVERSRVRLALPDLSVGGEAELRTGDGGRLEGLVELDGTPLGPLSPLLGVEEGLDGHLSATLALEIPLGRPAEAAATLDVAELAAVYQGQSLRAQPFRAELDEERLRARDVRLEGPGAFVDFSLSAGLGEDAPLELRAWLDADLASLPLPEGWSLGGRVDGAVGLAGTPVRPSLEGALHASGVTVSGSSIPAVTIDDMEVYLGDDGLRIPPTTAGVGNGRASLEGEIPYASVWTALREGELTPSERARLSVTWEGVPVGSFEGGLAGELTLEGGLASLEELEGELRLPVQHLSLEGLTLESQPATVRLAEGRVETDGVALRSGPGELVVVGGADLKGETVDLSLQGEIALGLLSPLVEDASVGGSAQVDLTLTGPFDGPVPGGSVRVDDMSLRLKALPQAVTGVSGRIELEETIATIDANGHLGGGTLHLEGEARVLGEEAGDSWLHLTGRNVALRYPPGLRSRLEVDLTLAGQPGDFVLAGDVAAQGGLYDLDAAVKEALRAPAPATTTSELLRDVALDVTVDIARPVVVQSSFGRLEAEGRITARGDLEEPAPFGRLDVRRGGRLEIQGRELTVTGGSLSYSGTWNADLSLSGETVVRNVEYQDGSRRDVRVRASLQGSIDQPSLALSSEPSLSRQEIVSVIATGRLQSSLVDSSAWLLGGQAATLVSSQLTRRVAQTFGLDEITVRPDLVARETDPSARFTFGKRIGQLLALVYSAGLGGPETRFAEVSVLPGYNVQVRGLRRDSGEYEVGLGQRFEFGEASTQTVADTTPRLEDVRFEGAPVDEALRDVVDLSVGKRVPDWRVQQQAERLRRRLREEGHLDAEVSGRVHDAVAVFEVDPGPVYTWHVEGMTEPPSLDDAFHSALFEADAVDRGRARLLEALRDRGHLRAAVETETREHEDRHEIVFNVEPGPRYDPVKVRFPGASTLSRRVLLEAAGGASGILQEPEAAVEGIREAYRARHLLAVDVGTPEVDERGSGVSLTVPVEEGPPAHLLWVRPEGSTLPESELRDALALTTGVPFETEAASAAVSRARTFYLSRGYADVRIRPEVVVEGHDLGLVLDIREGERHVVEDITLSGNTRTRDWLVWRTLDLEKGQPLDPIRLGRAERRLLELGTFSRSAIIPDAEQRGSLRVEVQEAANLSAAYDVRWEDGRGWSGLVDGLADNLLGLGVGLGGRARYGADFREFRGSLHLPAALTGGDVTGSVFRTVEDIAAEGFDIERIQKGFQIQQSLGRPSRLEVLLGYRFRRNLTVAPSLPEIPIDVGGLDVSFLRTTQDDLLDPHRGAFLSLNLSIAPSWLGSDAPLLKGFAQAVLARSFHEAAFSWAQGYRLGLAHGLDGEPVISNERFQAGGASSLRGFGTNEVGPRGFFGEPAGGEVVVIMNQELRYRHHPTGLGVVGFYDVGNVFEEIDSMRFDFRHTLGVGLRWASPVGLLRVDFGFPLDREPEEKSYRVFFGLGQAF